MHIIKLGTCVTFENSIVSGFTDTYLRKCHFWLALSPNQSILENIFTYTYFLSWNKSRNYVLDFFRNTLYIFHERNSLHQVSPCLSIVKDCLITYTLQNLTYTDWFDSFSLIIWTELISIKAGAYNPLHVYGTLLFTQFH